MLVGVGSLPGQQAFPACEAAAAVRGRRTETKPRMRNVGGVMIKTRKDRRKNVKNGKLNQTKVQARLGYLGLDPVSLFTVLLLCNYRTFTS